MKITIFGASGRTGTLLVTKALKAGFTVTAYVRKENSISVEDPKLEVVVGDLNDAEKVKTAVQGSAACLSTLGPTSLRRSSKDLIDGVRTILDEMKNEKVKRFIYLSSLGVNESRYFMGREAGCTLPFFC